MKSTNAGFALIAIAALAFIAQRANASTSGAPATGGDFWGGIFGSGDQLPQPIPETQTPAQATGGSFSWWFDEPSLTAPIPTAPTPTSDGDFMWFEFQPNPVTGGSGGGGGGGSMSTIDERVSAFLAMIREFESQGDYQALYGSINGSNQFYDFSKHPYEGKPLPKHSAAGAYQFIVRTWLALRDRLNLPDFSPQSQDAAAYELLRERGALLPLQNNNIPLAIQKVSSVWASLPYSTAGQNPKSLQQALNAYNNALSKA